VAQSGYPWLERLSPCDECLAIALLVNCSSLRVRDAFFEWARLIAEGANRFPCSSFLAHGRRRIPEADLDLPFIVFFKAMFFALKQLVKLRDIVEEFVAVFLGLHELHQPMHLGGFFRGHGYRDDTDYRR
jgi:hypothetical protein